MASLLHIILLAHPEVKRVDVATPTERSEPSSAEVVDDTSTSTENNPVAPISDLPHGAKRSAHIGDLERDVGGSYDSKHAVSVQGHAYVQLIGWQNTRRPRHPFPAQMAGVNPGRVPVHTAQKSSS